MAEKNLADHERAHPGPDKSNPVRHGQDAIGRPGRVFKVERPPEIETRYHKVRNQLEWD